MEEKNLLLSAEEARKSIIIILSEQEVEKAAEKLAEIVQREERRLRIGTIGHGMGKAALMAAVSTSGIVSAEPLSQSEIKKLEIKLKTPMADLKAFAEELVALSLKDVKELASVLKEEYGIEAKAAVSACCPEAETIAGNALVKLPRPKQQHYVPRKMGKADSRPKGKTRK